MSRLQVKKVIRILLPFQPPFVTVLGKDQQIDPDLSRLTTAKDTFQYIGISWLPQKQ